MIPTKTYPLSAITGDEKTDKERIAELADAFNRVCAENADFVAEANRDEARIAALEAENARLKAAMDKYSEDEVLGKLRGELLLRCCIEICQEESTDNSTAQKIEARIRALKVEK